MNVVWLTDKGEMGDVDIPDGVPAPDQLHVMEVGSEEFDSPWIIGQRTDVALGGIHLLVYLDGGMGWCGDQYAILRSFLGVEW